MEEGVAIAVIEAVADAEQVQPEELDPLYEYMEPSVLSALASRDDASWKLSFEVEDHEVKVTSEGSLFVDGYHAESDLLGSDTDG